MSWGPRKTTRASPKPAATPRQEVQRRWLITLGQTEMARQMLDHLIMTNIKEAVDRRRLRNYLDELTSVINMRNTEQWSLDQRHFPKKGTKK